MNAHRFEHTAGCRFAAGLIAGATIVVIVLRIAAVAGACA